MWLTIAGAYLTLWGSVALADLLHERARRREIARLESWLQL